MLDLRTFTFVLGCPWSSLIGTIFYTALGAELADLVKASHRSNLKTETPNKFEISRWHILYVVQPIYSPSFWQELAIIVLKPLLFLVEIV